MWLGRSIPFDRLGWLLILFASRSLLGSLFLFLPIIVPWVELAESDLDVSPSFLVELVGRWAKLLHLGFAWDHGQPLLKHLEHLVEVDHKVCLFLSLLLEELLELFLLFVDFETIHFVLAFIVRKQIVV